MPRLCSESSRHYPGRSARPAMSTLALKATSQALVDQVITQGVAYKKVSQEKTALH